MIFHHLLTHSRPATPISHYPSASHALELSRLQCDFPFFRTPVPLLLTTALNDNTMRSCRPVSVAPAAPTGHARYGGAPKHSRCCVRDTILQSCKKRKESTLKLYRWEPVHIYVGKVCDAFSSEALLHMYPSHSLQAYACHHMVSPLIRASANAGQCA